MNKSPILDSYPLAPIQAGMLLESLVDRTGAYLIQIVIRLDHALELLQLQLAYLEVMARHSILRTGLRWAGLDTPVQEVYDQLELPFQVGDLRPLTAPEQQLALERYLAEDRQRGFDLSRAPLHRLALFQLADERHTMVWTVQHAIIDGQSLIIFLEELFQIYEALAAGRQPALPLPRPYREYVEWMQAQDFSPAERYWRARLRGFRSPTLLGVERPLAFSSVDSAQAGQEQVETNWLRLSSELSQELNHLAQIHGFTLNTLAQGAWALLLSRYGGEREVVFGATRSCRRSVLGGDTANLFGPLLNTLPVRASLTGDRRLIPWLQELRQGWIEMRPFENTPLLRIAAWSEIPPGQPLFNSFCDFEAATYTAALRARSASWEHRSVEVVQWAPYPLVATLYAGPEIELKITCRRREFEPGLAARISSQLRVLLERMVERPESRLDELSLLGQAERRQILEEWNATRREYPKELCAHQLVEAQVQRTPHLIAAVESWPAKASHPSALPTRLSHPPGLPVSRFRALTYQELNAAANQLARYLRKLGVGPEVVVGVCMERSLELFVALLGILKAGGVYLPLEPELPAARLAFLFQDSRARLLLTKVPYRDRFSTGEAPTLCLDSDWAVAAGESPDNLDQLATPGNLAYIIYTSGSTGPPKGVGVHHQALVNYLEWMRPTYNMAPGDRLLQLSSIGFDASVWNFLATLSTGVEVVLTAPDRQLDVPHLVEVIQTWQTTFLHMVPSRLSLFLEEPRLKDCASVRFVVTGGEASSPALVERFHQLLPVPLSNNYGPTETAISVLTAIFRPGSRLEIIPIGRPHPNCQLYLLDRRLEPVPVGVTGELYLAGDCLARGYLDQPALTAEKFIPNPFSARGERMYRSGDLARWLPDGQVEFLGRADSQVKLRGIRIELGEVEAALESHPQVRQAAVLLQQGESGPYLAAYLDVIPGSQLEIGQVREFLKKSLPESMLPAGAVFLDALPRLSSGKIDRRALAQMDFEALQSRPAPVSARTPLEQEVAEIIAQVLGREEIGIQDDFFELGGDSLLVMRAVSRVNHHFDVELPLRVLFESPTVDGLAAALARELGPYSGNPPR